MSRLTPYVTRRVMLSFLKGRPTQQEFLCLAILMKEAGLNQAEVTNEFYAAMNEIPDEDEEMHDRICDALDFIVGFCCPGSGVFPDGE